METPSTKKTPAGRYALLDELRGLDLISMMLYHGCWDLIFLFGVQADWYYAAPGRFWQQSICWIFILLSGFCVPLGHHTLRRGAIVFGGGALVTAVTLLFMPGDRVVFGVLTMLGSAMILTALLEPVLKKIPPAGGILMSALLFMLTRYIAYGYIGVGRWIVMLPDALYANYLTAFFGFMPWWFYSTDYFPLMPWIFLFWVGYFLHHIIGRERMEPLRRSVCPPLGWLGRHSLLLYLLHQPVIYGVLYLIFRIF